MNKSFRNGQTESTGSIVDIHPYESAFVRLRR